MDRGGSAEAKKIRAWLMWEACFPSGVVVISDPSQLPRHFSGSVALLKPQFVLMFTAPVTTKDHEESWGLGSHMCPCLCPMATPLQGLSRSEWPELPPRTMVASGGELLLNDWVWYGIARVLLRSVTSVAIVGHTIPLLHYLGGLSSPITMLESRDRAATGPIAI